MLNICQRLNIIQQKSLIKSYKVIDPASFIPGYIICWKIKYSLSQFIKAATTTTKRKEEKQQKKLEQTGWLFLEKITLKNLLSSW